jgi:hypothetical protein
MVDLMKKVPSLAVLLILKLIILMIFLTIPRGVYGETKLDVGARLSLDINNYLEDIDYYFVAAEVRAEIEIIKDLQGVLELDADRFEVFMDEISLRWERWDYLYLAGGKLENYLTLEEYLPEHKWLFSTKNLTSRHVIDLGYITSSVGIMIYKEYSEKTHPVSYYFQTLFNPIFIEPEIGFGFFYHFNEQDSYLGLLGSYFPFVFQVREFGQERHNFLINLVWANLENDFVYGIETTFGSNLVDPIGLQSFPRDFDRSFFMGGDLHVGYALNFGAIQWIPLIRYSILFPEISEMKANQMEILLGNLVRVLERLYFHIDAGLGIETKYISDDLFTKLEMLWAFSIVAKV